MEIQLTEKQSHYVLNHLMTQKVVDKKAVEGALSNLQSEIRTIEARLDSLKSAAGMERPATRVVGKIQQINSVTPPRKRNRKPKTTATIAASRKIQGEYLGLLHHFSGSVRKTFSDVAKNEGREEAIRLMRMAV